MEYQIYLQKYILCGLISEIRDYEKGIASNHNSLSYGELPFCFVLITHHSLEVYLNIKNIIYIIYVL